MKISFDKKDEQEIKKMPSLFLAVVYLALAFCNIFMFGALFHGLSTLSAYDEFAIRMGFITLVILFINVAVYVSLAISTSRRSRQ